MSKIAIISDIHANADALKLVLKDIEKRGCNQIVCIGDIVTKFYQPAESVDIVRSVSSIVIVGNCDWHLAHNTNFKLARHHLKALRFKTGAHVQEIIEKLEKERGLMVRDINGLEYLQNLPDGVHYLNNMTTNNEIELGGALIRLYHSNPQDLYRIFNPVSPQADQLEKNKKIGIKDHKEMFRGNEPQTSIVGHTHEPFIGFDKGSEFRLVEHPEDGVLITNQDRAVINVGSAGERINMEFNGPQFRETILPTLSYAIVDDFGKNDGSFVASIINVPITKYEHKTIFDGFVNAQISGKYAFSPNDTKKLGGSIIYNNPDDEELKNKIEHEMEYNREIEKSGFKKFLEDATAEGIGPDDPEFNQMVAERGFDKQKLLEYYKYLAEVAKENNSGTKKR